MNKTNEKMTITLNKRRRRRRRRREGGGGGGEKHVELDPNSQLFSILITEL